MKKLLNTLYVTEEDAYLSLDGENIVVKMSDERVFRLPFVTIDSIYCFSYLGCSPALIGKCCQEGVAISFISPNGRFLGRVIGASRGNVILRKAQVERFAETDILLVHNTVATKLANTRAVIKRSLKDYPRLDEDGSLTGCLSKLESAISAVYNMTDKMAVLGLEGNCAKAYFDVFDRLILKQKDDFYMTFRTKRPPLDRANAVLSFLYSMYTRDYASALESVGLDSYIGFYHELRPGRSSLACDLVEETRCIVERFVLTMINLRQINADDFETQVSGAVFLTKDGMKKVLALWQDKKRSVIIHPYLKQKVQFGLIPYIQSQLLAKYIRGEINEYPTFMMK